MASTTSFRHVFCRSNSHHQALRVDVDRSWPSDSDDYSCADFVSSGGGGGSKSAAV